MKDSARERVYSVKRQSNLIQNVRSPYIPDCEPIGEEDNLDEFKVLDEEFFTFLETLKNGVPAANQVSPDCDHNNDYLEEICAGNDESNNPTSEVLKDMDLEDISDTELLEQSNNEDFITDVIEISDDDENTCRDIVQSELKFHTSVHVMPLTTRTASIGGETVYEKTYLENEYYQYFD